MKLIDKYILKRYLATFIVMLLLFIPIGIVVDVADRINKMLANKVPFESIALYYLDFTVYFANMLFPIFLFLSIIWFTSKLANNTEIVAILSSGISFNRFLRPYIFGATCVSIFALLMGFFIVPKASEGYNNFRYMYLKGNGRNNMRQLNDLYRQINDTTFLYVESINQSNQTAFNLTIEQFNSDRTLNNKITSSRIKFNPKDTTYTMYNFNRRTVGSLDDHFEIIQKKDTVFDFDFEDLTPTVYVAETLTLGELNKFIKKERDRGSSNINTYLVVLYRKYSIPISAFILTIIAVSVSAMKRRGGMGANLAIGIAIAFSYIFLDKVFGVMAEKSSIPPLIAVWLPNLFFGILGYYLLKNARK